MSRPSGADDEKLISLAAMTAAAARITVSKALAEAVQGALCPSLSGYVHLRSLTVRTCGLAGADLVVEAVPDELGLKQRLFADLHTMCEAKTVFSTNSINLDAVRANTHTHIHTRARAHARKHTHTQSHTHTHTHTICMLCAPTLSHTRARARKPACSDPGSAQCPIRRIHRHRSGRRYAAAARG
jgi:hypothetical protein